MGYQLRQAPSSAFSCIYQVLSDEAELSQGPRPEQPNTGRTTKAWTACDTQLSPRESARLLSFTYRAVKFWGIPGCTDTAGLEKAHLIHPQKPEVLGRHFLRLKS